MTLSPVSTEEPPRILSYVLWFIRIASVCLLVCSVALNFANIVGRYFFSASITWAEEGMLFLMIGCVFLGAGGPAWSGRHIRMDVFLRMLPEKARDALYLLSDVALVATSLVLVLFAWPTILQLQEFDQRSLAANIPLVIPQSLIPIGLLLMAILVLTRLFTSGRRSHPPGDTH